MPVRSAKLVEGRVEGVRVEGAPYGPVDPDRLSDKQPRPVREVPTTRKPRRLRRPTEPALVLRAGDDPPAGRDPVRFHNYGPAGTLTKNLTNAADMSGADGRDDVVMLSGNWYCDVSTDAGGSWTRLDPTTIFPEDLGGGFCCDQVITYVNEFDRFVWFLQYGAGTDNQGAFRIATASSDSVGNDPTVWTYWDFMAGDFGFPKSDMDYPDLAFSDRFLYVSTDVFEPGGRLVLRILLSDLAAGGTIGFQYIDPAKATSAWGAHLVQQTRSQAVWIGQPDNSRLEVFTMPDGGNTYSSFNVNVATWPNGAHSSMGPDGNDWLTKLRDFPNFAVTGGVERGNGNVVVAWSASSGKGSANGFDFPNSHSRVVEIDMGTRAVISEMQVWNEEYAFTYPALAVNGKDEVGIILGWGGPDNHANCAMGIIGDFVVWFQDASTRTVQRFGDYLTTRPATRERELFGGFGYFVTEVSGQPTKCTYNPIYVRYGR